MSSVSQGGGAKETGRPAYLQIATTNAPGCPRAGYNQGPAAFLSYNTDQPPRLVRYLHVAPAGLLKASNQPTVNVDIGH